MNTLLIFRLIHQTHFIIPTDRRVCPQTDFPSLNSAKKSTEGPKNKYSRIYEPLIMIVIITTCIFGLHRTVWSRELPRNSRETR